MKKNVKRSVRRKISILLAVCLTVCCLPVNAFAWKNLTHVTSANLTLLEMLRSSGGQVTIYAPYNSDEGYTYTVPREYYEALVKYPEAFRAGSMGPDFYPDMLTGQGFIHPYDKAARIGSGEWITLLCNSVNMMPKDSDERKRALSFTLGFMLHYCGDIFGHDFVNQYAGGTFPSVTDALSSERDLNTMLSHMSEETYIDSKVNWDFYKKSNMLNIAAPVEFISDTLLYDGAKNNGSAQIYKTYGSVPAIYEYLIELRTYLYNEAERMRPYCDPASSAVVIYLDRWIADLDRATDALVQCFDSMAGRMVTVSDPNMVNIISDEITTWFNEYGKYITPLPDDVADLAVEGAKGLFQEVIDGFSFVENTGEMKSKQIQSLSLTHIGIPGLDEKIREYTTRMNDPAVQLDYSSNPFSPANKEEGGNFREFDAFVSGFEEEGVGLGQISYENILNENDGGALDRAIDSDFYAFYNTIVMFKLILIGPDNFSDFIKKVSNLEQIQYQQNTAELYATSLKLDVKTADTEKAGTDDNIFALVYDKENSESTPIIEKLLDKSGNDDFENSVESSYTVELGRAVKLSDIEVDIVQVSTGLPEPEWDCESIAVTPYHAGAALIEPIGFGGRYGMKSGDTWKLCFNDELMLRTQISEKWDTLGALSAKVTISTNSATGAGTDDDVYLEVYNNDTGLVRSILLDKKNHNDFETGCKDTYRVPLADNLTDTIPLEKLNMKITCSGNTADGTWNVKSLDIELYHGEIQLTDTISRGPKEFHNDTWNLNITGDIKRKDCYCTPITLSYITDVDDGMLDYVYSLDGSHQYVNSKSPLWSDAAIRKEVFFKIFKGFAPDIEYVGEEKTVSECQAFDMDFYLEGMWNGVSESRRNEVYYNSNMTPGNSDDYPVMPKVSGDATISFLDSEGNVVCSVEKTVSSGEIQLRGYKNDSLTAGTYSVEVRYDPDSAAPMYAAAERVFNDKLTVTAAADKGSSSSSDTKSGDSSSEKSGAGSSSEPKSEGSSSEKSGADSSSETKRGDSSSEKSEAGSSSEPKSEGSSSEKSEAGSSSEEKSGDSSSEKSEAGSSSEEKSGDSSSEKSGAGSSSEPKSEGSSSEKSGADSSSDTKSEAGSSSEEKSEAGSSSEEKSGDSSSGKSEAGSSSEAKSGDSSSEKSAAGSSSEAKSGDSSSGKSEAGSSSDTKSGDSSSEKSEAGSSSDTKSGDSSSEKSAAGSSSEAKSGDSSSGKSGAGSSSDTKSGDSSSEKSEAGSSSDTKSEDSSSAKDTDSSSSEQAHKVLPSRPTDTYAAENDNIAPVSQQGSIKKLQLDISGLQGSGVAPEELKMTVIKGTKLTTVQKLKDSDSVQTTGGIKAKVNKKTMLLAITCKESGSVSFVAENGAACTLAVTVQTPKADKNVTGKITTGSGRTVLSVKDIFGTDINAGELTVVKEKVQGQAVVDGDRLIIDPVKPDKIKLRYKYLNKKYNAMIKIR